VNCQETEQALVEQQTGDRPLTAAVEAHLVRCATCSQLRQEYAQVWQLLELWPAAAPRVAAHPGSGWRDAMATALLVASILLAYIGTRVDAPQQQRPTSEQPGEISLRLKQRFEDSGLSDPLVMRQQLLRRRRQLAKAVHQQLGSGLFRRKTNEVRCE